MDYVFLARHFGVMIISLYAYRKILNIKELPKSKIVAAVIFSLAMSVLLSFAPLPEFLLLGSVGLFVIITAKVELPLMASAVVISVGIGYGIDTTAAAVLALGVLAPFVAISSFAGVSEEALQVVTPMVAEVLWYIEVALALVLAGVLFNIKRLNSGFVFLRNRNTRLVGIVFSVFIIILIQFWYITTSYTTGVSDGELALITLFFLLVTNICMVGIHFWWRSHTSLLYQERLRESLIREYQTDLDEKDETIKELSECNELLAHTVHRDNKLIPALHYAVSSFIDAPQGIDEDEAKARGARILAELDDVMQERREMISGIQREHTPLKSTGIERVDSILNYMFKKALEKGVQFDFVTVTSIKDRAETDISKQDFEVLLADLLENALIAVSYNSYKRILLTMGVVDDCFEIIVQDSGVPFELEILANLGTKKATTHADTGGSGIGYISTFNILEECKASLIIQEQAPENYAFSKSIKVRFDGRSEFVIHSYRADSIKPSTEREGMHILQCR